MSDVLVLSGGHLAIGGIPVGDAGQSAADVVADPLLMSLWLVLLILLGWEGGRWWRRWKAWQYRRLIDGAKEIVILPPVEVDPAGAQLWWSQIAPLIRRSSWRRLVFGPVHIAMEYRWAGRELQIIVWVPGVLPITPIAAAARAAWEGATTSIRDATPPLGETATRGSAPPAEPGRSRSSTSARRATSPQGRGEGPAEGQPGRTADQPAGRPAARRKGASSAPAGPPVAPPDGHPADEPEGPEGLSRGLRARVMALLMVLFGRMMDGHRPGDVARHESAALPPSPRSDASEPGSEGISSGYVTAAAGRYLGAQLPGWYVFSTRADHGLDPMRALIEQGTTLTGTECACVQVLVRRASVAQVRRVRSGAVGLKTGQRARGGGLLVWVADLLPAVMLTGLRLIDDAIAMLVGAGRASARGSSGARGTAGRTGARVGPATPLRDQDVRPGLEKVRTGPLWEISMRVVVARTSAQPPKPKPRLARRGDGAADRDEARAQMLAHALTSALAVHDGRNGLRPRTMRGPVRVLAGRRMGRASTARGGAFLLSSPELSSVAGLPTDVAVPGMDRARARNVPAPVVVPTGGRSVKVLGRSAVGGQSVGIPVADARQHVHVLGSTGVGKSTLLCRQVLGDINAGRGVVLIDPKGDLALDVLDRLPAHAMRRLTLIDPDQPRGSAGFNPLQLRPGTDPDLLVDNLASIFSSIFNEFWGPRMDDVLRNCCLTLMLQPDARLTMVPSLLNNKQIRAQYTAELRDPAGLGGFWEWYESTPAALRAQVIGPVLARLRAFLGRDFARRTIGVASSTFDMGQILDGGILIARLPKGQLGEDTSKLMSAMLLASVWQAAITRARLPEQDRRDATVYTDEAHNILHIAGSVTDMLAEARAYHVSFVLAHQNLSQLPREVKEGLSANARNKVFFNCSPEDARVLSQHTVPELGEHDLGHLDAFHAAARLVVGNRETSAFTLVTSPMPPADPKSRRRVRDHIARTGPDLSLEDLPIDTGTIPRPSQAPSPQPETQPAEEE